MNDYTGRSARDSADAPKIDDTPSADDREYASVHDRERAWRAREDAAEERYRSQNPGAEFDYIYGVLTTVDVAETIVNVPLGLRPTQPDRMP